jgi:hypothetical protein
VSDLFISYSKPDRDLVLKLATFLEAEGWSVWYDKGLVPGDQFRDEIMKQLAAARAVIVVWTEYSIKSEWVRAESGRAKADGKLIPTKTPSLSYDEIPLPFGEMHTENATSFDLVRAAVVAQLAKPAITPSPFRLITKNVQFQLLSWIGIIGGAITLFANLHTVLGLADWARVLVQRWHEITTAFWSFLLAWMGFKIPTEIVPLLSFLLFATILVIGINLTRTVPKRCTGNDNDAPARHHLKVLLIGIAIWSAIVLVVVVVGVNIDRAPYWYVVFPGIVLAILAWIFPLAFILYVSKRRLLVFGAWCLFAAIGIVLLIPIIQVSIATSRVPRDPVINWSIGIAMLVFQLSQFVCILLTPTTPLIRRLGVLMIGLVVLVGLSEISKLNLRQYLQPPRATLG